MRFGSTTALRRLNSINRFHYTNFRLFDDNSEAIWITDRGKVSRPGVRPPVGQVSRRGGGGVNEQRLACVYRKLMSASVCLSQTERDRWPRTSNRPQKPISPKSDPNRSTLFPFHVYFFSYPCPSVRSLVPDQYCVFGEREREN